MPRLRAANNAVSLLSGDITDVATSLVVADSTTFPDAPFLVTIDDEIIEVGAITRATHTLSSLLRGREGTAQAAHSDGVRVENRFTAGTYTEIADRLSGLPDQRAYLHDDSDVSASGTGESTRKTFRMVKDAALGLARSQIALAAELRVNSTSTGTIRLYQGTTLLLEVSTDSTSFVLQTAGPVDISAWPDGIYDFEVRLTNSSTRTTYNRFLEIYVS